MLKNSTTYICAVLYYVQLIFLLFCYLFFYQEMQIQLFLCISKHRVQIFYFFLEIKFYSLCIILIKGDSIVNNITIKQIKRYEINAVLCSINQRILKKYLSIHPPTYLIFVEIMISHMYDFHKNIKHYNHSQH